jgi:hypothetical protein
MITENKSIADSVAALSKGVRNKLILSALEHAALSAAAAAAHDSIDNDSVTYTARVRIDGAGRAKAQADKCIAAIFAATAELDALRGISIVSTDESGNDATGATRESDCCFTGEVTPASSFANRVAREEVRAIYDPVASAIYQLVHLSRGWITGVEQ